MKTLFVLTLFMAISCASKKPTYEFDNLEFKSFAYADIENRDVYITYRWIDLEKRYFEYEKSGQINKDLDKSCLDNANSVNFVNITLADIPQFRPYVSKQKYDVTYKAVTATDSEGRYESLHFEKRVDRMTVEQRSCYKKIKGELYYVTSEAYTYD
jgi:hypothetical protein